MVSKQTFSNSLDRPLSIIYHLLFGHLQFSSFFWGFVSLSINMLLIHYPYLIAPCKTGAFAVLSLVEDLFSKFSKISDLISVFFVFCCLLSYFAVYQLLPTEQKMAGLESLPSPWFFWRVLLLRPWLPVLLASLPLFSPF